MVASFLVQLGFINPKRTGEANIVTLKNGDQLHGPPGDPLTFKQIGEATIGILQNGGQLLGPSVIR
jgi:hypothetical protein